MDNRDWEVAGTEVNPSPPATTEVKNEWSYTSSPPICLQGVDRENLTLTLIGYVSDITCRENYGKLPDSLPSFSQ